MPFEVVGVDFDNGRQFINHGVIAWAAEAKIFSTRSRPYKKNDQATIITGPAPLPQHSPTRRHFLPEARTPVRGHLDMSTP